ncbi:GIY-YIG nuclease family protein [Alkalihalophilus pseudofirmus]|uniref:GIY-YIG nuclease family protein n=1 Tax=Alkalihalophilus pseudofirmus TaxID=79885 RepID=UPI00259BE83D|nr:GIY-YIG nuclease family protein [Alkalihalophilus pseudofirmus]WEG18630.1 GIY-YIG nuclease family protein [Alkalihalophilus pseudofirmus]
MSRLATSIIGEKFNRLIVVDQYQINGKGKTICECKCDCGSKRLLKVNYSEIKRGKVKSCGCLVIENTKKANTKHKNSNSHLHNVWCKMKSKCYNHTSKYFKNYGGKGIEVYKYWLGVSGYDNFYDWSMSNGYSKGLYLSRKDKMKDYSPDNCLWGKSKETYNNESFSMKSKLSINGSEYTLEQICSLVGISFRAVVERIKNNYLDERMLMTTMELKQINLKQKHDALKMEEYDYTPFTEIGSNMIAEKSKSGIYEIKNNLNNKVYVGSAVDIFTRWKNHINNLNRNTHHSKHLQNAWNKYGGGNFKFKVLEYVDKDHLINREQYWMDELNAYSSDLGYNIQSIAGSPLGRKMSDETKQNWSKSRRKPVVQLKEDDGIVYLVARWDGIKDAAKHLNLHEQNISHCCKNFRIPHRCGGFIWMYANEFDNLLINNDKESSSSKNKKAKDLGVPIINEEEFVSLIK